MIFLVQQVFLNWIVFGPYVGALGLFLLPLDRWIFLSLCVLYYFLQMYGMPGTVSPNAMIYGQMGHHSPSFPYRPVRGYMIPSPSVLQYSRPIVGGVTTEIIPTTPSPHHPGISIFSDYFSFSTYLLIHLFSLPLRG